MPYLSASRIDELNGEWKDLNGGDINYLFTKLMIKKWRALPRYQTIHNLKVAVTQPAVDMEFWDLRATLMEHGVSEIDIKVGMDLAFQEFYRRVASEYEDFKASTNSDLYAETIDELMSGGC